MGRERRDEDAYVKEGGEEGDIGSKETEMIE